MFDIPGFSLLSQDNIVLIVLCLVLIVFDVICGNIKAFKTRTYRSGAGRDGIFHKTALVLIIILGIICHVAQMYVDLGIHAPLLNLICTFIIFTEIMSIVENIAEINPALKDTPLFSLFAFADVDKINPKGGKDND